MQNAVKVAESKTQCSLSFKVDEPPVPEPAAPPPGIGGPGVAASSSDAPQRAAAPHRAFRHRAAGADRPVRSMRWGPFTVAPIVADGEVLVGWGARCGMHHNQGDGKKVECKT